MVCPSCGTIEKQSRAGTSNGRQRYKCGACGRRYTQADPSRGYASSLRVDAIRLRSSGATIRDIAVHLDVNHQTVANWLRKADEQDPKLSATATEIQGRSSVSARVTEEPRRPTITDVAKRAGVSVSSVSNFLNEKGHLGESARQRIQQSIEELHFTPSALMRAIRHRRTSIMGVLMHGLTTMDETIGKSITPPLLAGILRGADIANYNVLLYPHLLYTLHNEATVPFLDGHIDGLLWFAPRMGDSVLTRIAQAGLPTIALLTKDVPDRIGFVNTDGADGVIQAVRHLVDLGHRQIAYIGARRQSNFIDRHLGYRQALVREKLPWSAPFDIALMEGWQNEDIKTALDEWRALSDPPTAVVAATDSIAHSLIRAALESGLRIPKDLSVVGFDDIPDAEHIGGGLTTIRQPFRQVGLLAAESLAALIAGAPVESCRKTIRTELIIRKTTGAPSRRLAIPDQSTMAEA